jgi:aminopeptidase N
MLREGQNPPVRRADYTAPAYWIETVDLTFDLDPVKTRVLNRMTVRRNADAPAQALRLDGEDLTLTRVLVNGQGTSFKVDNGQLVLENLPDGNEPFQLELFTVCYPTKNTQLMGLYVSNDSFFTQCEAEGFRRITYFLDRPDVMSSYTVTLRADKAKFPVLLSNGNLVGQGVLDDGRHFARWHDPHRKPCYLFALVAGLLVAREQRIVSRSGTEHVLQVYVRPGDLDKTEHAMRSLMASVAWDEARFGLPLDLERFMIVATSDFNMGAMENKGLNIFNTKYVLASAATATDVDFGNIESVVGHEYFHNWTGNRVTCRDWFQLSLKEGLTVFRDQEFSQDMAHEASARAVKRIEDVRLLRTVQFPEDAGPMAHPVRPDQYQEINNFYTVTIYEKGAEVVRMMQTLAATPAQGISARDGFARGMALYFQRHDGQAVTCDDFAQAIADANPQSQLAALLPQFKRWYSQSGTPVVSVSSHWDADAATYRLTLSQHCAPTPGQAAEAAPFVIPVELGLLSEDGESLPLFTADGAVQGEHSTTAVLTESSITLTFIGITARPVPSVLRGFSAPVVLEWNATEPALLTQLRSDTDAFNRWEASQRLALSAAIAFMERGDDPLAGAVLGAAHVAALREVLLAPGLDAAFKELVLTLPAENYIAEQLPMVDPQRIHAVREAMRRQLAIELQTDWVWAFEQHQDNGAYRPDPVSSGRRALAGLALAYLCLACTLSAEPVWPGKAYQRVKDASNMTDRFNALQALVSSGHALAAPALERFYSLFQHEELVIDKWFALQAGASDRQGHVLPLVRQLMNHPDFNLRNPNRARSLIFSLCSANPGAFHRPDAGGYVFWRERVLELDAFNPQVAARLARALDRWKKLAEPYRSAAREAISRVAAKPDLSNDVREVITRALADD